MKFISCRQQEKVVVWFSVFNSATRFRTSLLSEINLLTIVKSKYRSFIRLKSGWRHKFSFLLQPLILSHVLTEVKAFWNTTGLVHTSSLWYCILTDFEIDYCNFVLAFLVKSIKAAPVVVRANILYRYYYEKKYEWVYYLLQQYGRFTANNQIESSIVIVNFLCISACVLR